MKTIIKILLILCLLPCQAWATVTIGTHKPYVNWSYGSITIPGTCSRTDGVGYYISTDGTIENAITGHTGAVLDADTTGNVFSGTITNIPDGDATVNGGNIYIVVYHLQATGDYDISDSIACGDVLFRAGQSNQSMNATGSLTSTPNAALWHYAEEYWPVLEFHGPLAHPATAGEGDVAFGNAIIAATGRPLLIINTSYAGAPITYWESGASPDMMDAILDRAEDLTGVRDAHGLSFWQGENEAGAGQTESYYETHLQTVVDRFEANTHSGLIFIPTEIGRYTWDGVTDSVWSGIKNGTKDTISSNSNMFFGGTTVEFPLQDFVHLTYASRTKPGQYAAYAWLWSQNLANAYRGSICQSWEAVDSTHTKLRFLHPSGTDFATITGDSHGIRVTDNGTEETISDVSRTDANSITITHGTVSGTRDVDIGYGISPADYANWIHDNSSYVSGGFPIETNTRIPEYSANAVTPSVAITTSSGDNFNTEETTVDLAGTSSDAVGVVLVKWSNDNTGQSGECHGTTSWTITDVAIEEGNNVFTITAYDSALNEGTDTITIGKPLPFSDGVTLSDYYSSVKSVPVSFSDGVVLSDGFGTNWYMASFSDGVIVSDTFLKTRPNVYFNNVYINNVRVKE